MKLLIVVLVGIVLVSSTIAQRRCQRERDCERDEYCNHRGHCIRDDGYGHDHSRHRGGLGGDRRGEEWRREEDRHREEERRRDEWRREDERRREIERHRIQSGRNREHAARLPLA